ncbi:MAG: hypothetical protein JRD89_06060 [Deltaproteobacteria bacterium]|nr:hypothetical protein [Deltaproteobacteria bacterium]
MVMKTAEEARKNLEDAVPYIPDRYESGIRKADWKTPAASDEAENNFKTVMTQVIAEKKRQKAIQRIDNTDWQNDAIEKGKPIIGERIRAAIPKQSAAWAPIYEGVQRAVEALPRRTVDWRENINKRLVPVVEQWKKGAGKL